MPHNKYEQIQAVSCNNGAALVRLCLGDARLMPGGGKILPLLLKQVYFAYIRLLLVLVSEIVAINPQEDSVLLIFFIKLRVILYLCARLNSGLLYKWSAYCI